MSVTHNPPAGLVGEAEWLGEHLVDLTAADVGAEATGAVATHEAALDPHTGYRKESDDHTHASTGAQGGTIAYSDLTGKPTLLALGTSPSTQAFGDLAAGGAATDAAKTDHKHAMMANPVTAHEAAADPHTGYLKENDANWTDLTDGGATTLHTHTGGAGVTLDEVIDALYPVGALYVSTVSTNPGTLLGRGTWAAFGAGRVMVGHDSGDADFDTAEETGGAKTKAISAHASTAVADHAAQSHSAHAGATVANHTDVTNHVHVQSVNSATTGGLSGYTPDTSTNTSTSSGYSTANPTSIGVAAMVHTVGQANNHSDHAALSHSVTQPAAHTDLNVVQPYIVVHMWKRTA